MGYLYLFTTAMSLLLSHDLHVRLLGDYVLLNKYSILDTYLEGIDQAATVDVGGRTVQNCWLSVCRLANVTRVGHRRTGHFWRGGGWIDFARKIWGSARKMNSRTDMIKQDQTRKLDYIDCGKSLKNLYLHLHCPFIINIR